VAFRPHLAMGLALTSFEISVFHPAKIMQALIKFLIHIISYTYKILGTGCSFDL